MRRECTLGSPAGSVAEPHHDPGEGMSAEQARPGPAPVDTLAPRGCDGESEGGLSGGNARRKESAPTTPPLPLSARKPSLPPLRPRVAPPPPLSHLPSLPALPIGSPMPLPPRYPLSAFTRHVPSPCPYLPNTRVVRSPATYLPHATALAGSSPSAQPCRQLSCTCASVW